MRSSPFGSVYIVMALIDGRYSYGPTSCSGTCAQSPFRSVYIVMALYTYGHIQVARVNALSIPCGSACVSLYTIYCCPVVSLYLMYFCWCRSMHGHESPGFTLTASVKAVLLSMLAYRFPNPSHASVLALRFQTRTIAVLHALCQCVMSSC